MNTAFKSTLFFGEPLLILHQPFIPSDDIDAFGGSIVIITDWYKPKPKADEICIIFCHRAELRSDAITVQTYFQKRVGGSWVDAGRDDQLARRLEELVLTRARELRSTGFNENKIDKTTWIKRTLVFQFTYL